MTDLDDRVLINTTTLSALIDVPVGTLQVWRHRNQGPVSILLNGRIAYRWSDVAAWIDRRAAETARGERVTQNSAAGGVPPTSPAGR